MDTTEQLNLQGCGYRGAVLGPGFRRCLQGEKEGQVFQVAGMAAARSCETHGQGRRVGGARALVGSESSQMLKAECLAFPLGNRTIKAVTQEGCWPAYLLTLPGWLRGGSGRWKSV